MANDKAAYFALFGIVRQNGGITAIIAVLHNPFIDRFIQKPLIPMHLLPEKQEHDDTEKERPRRESVLRAVRRSIAHSAGESKIDTGASGGGGRGIGYHRLSLGSRLEATSNFGFAHNRRSTRSQSPYFAPRKIIYQSGKSPLVSIYQSGKIPSVTLTVRKHCPQGHPSRTLRLQSLERNKLAIGVGFFTHHH